MIRGKDLKKSQKKNGNLAMAESDLVKAESELMMIRESELMNHHLTLTPWATRRAVRERTLV